MSEGDGSGEYIISKRRRTPRRSWEGNNVNTEGRTNREEERTARREVLAPREGETFRKSSPELLEGINRNGLVIFLLVCFFPPRLISTRS